MELLSWSPLRLVRYISLGLVKFHVQLEEVVWSAVGGHNVDRRHGGHCKQRQASQQLQKHGLLDNPGTQVIFKGLN